MFNHDFCPSCPFPACRSTVQAGFQTGVLDYYLNIPVDFYFWSKNITWIKIKKKLIR